MSWSPPIHRRANRNLLNDDRFFRLLTQECIRFADKDTARTVYMMVLAVVAQELNRHGMVRLPHLGDLGLVKQKPRPAWCGKVHVLMPARKVLRFYPNYYARQQFNKKQDF